jgi:hypothetical protein
MAASARGRRHGTCRASAESAVRPGRNLSAAGARGQAGEGIEGIEAREGVDACTGEVTPDNR